MTNTKYVALVAQGSDERAIMYLFKPKFGYFKSNYGELSCSWLIALD